MNQSNRKSVYEQVRRTVDYSVYNYIYTQACGVKITTDRTYGATCMGVNQLLWQKIKARTGVFTFEYRWHVITSEMLRRDL